MRIYSKYDTVIGIFWPQGGKETVKKLLQKVAQVLRYVLN